MRGCIDKYGWREWPLVAVDTVIVLITSVFLLAAAIDLAAKVTDGASLVLVTVFSLTAAVLLPARLVFSVVTGKY